MSERDKLLNALQALILDSTDPKAIAQAIQSWKRLQVLPPTKIYQVFTTQTDNPYDSDFELHGISTDLEAMKQCFLSQITTILDYGYGDLPKLEDFETRVRTSFVGDSVLYHYIGSHICLRLIWADLL